MASIKGLVAQWLELDRVRFTTALDTDLLIVLE